jgi:V/A-type H+-transporting ATPase subunit E
MAQTIEAFINQVQQDGVQAGQEAAARIQAEAEQQAQQILKEAEAEAKRILDEAKTEADGTRSRVQTELKLAARDTITRLQQALSQAMQGVLFSAARQKLSDVSVVESLLHDVVKQYVAADADGKVALTINVSDEMRHQLVDWAIRTMHDSPQTETSIDLHGSLKDAGFEYKVDEGTVEVTTESVGTILLELVGPEVRKLVAEAVSPTHGRP